MTFRVWCCAAVVLQSLLAFADPAIHNFTRDGRALPAAFAPAGDTVAVIVQFRDVPLFARNRAQLASNAVERAAAIRSFDDRFAALDRDLARIDGAHIAANAAERIPSRITARYSRTFAGAAVTASRDAIERIGKLDYVRAVHVDRPMEAFLDHSVPKIRAPEVWAAYGTRGKDVVVAVIDTGIDYNHPAFGGGFGPGHRVAGGWDFINNDADPIDDAGHGTHVAGIVGGNGGGILGVAPEVTFLAFKVLSAQGSGSTSVVLSGIERAADPNGDGNPADHADVANVSLGGAGTPDDPVSQAVETATAAGVIFCIATGNAGAYQTIASPGNAPAAISVGATALDDTIAAFSSRGPVSNTLAIKPDVVAPGVGIVSARAGGGTLAASGTSMATPHVAGVAALLRAIHRDWPVEHVKSAIVGTAVPLDADVMEQGGGRVDALRAAGADVIATPSTLSLGRDDVAQTHWTPTKTFTLVNRGTTSRTLALAAPSPRDGVTLTLSATSVTLAPGETREITLSFDVDNANVPSPVEGSLAIAGVVTITGGAMPLRVPWAFVKAAVVTIVYDDDNPYEAFVANTNSTALARILVEPGQRTGTATVPAGEYDIKITPFPFQTGDPRYRVIVLEKQAVDNAMTFTLSPNAASFEIIGTVKDERGLPLENIARGNGQCQQSLVMTWPPHSALALSAMSIPLREGFLVTPMSERFTLVPFQRCLDYGRNFAYSAQLEPIQGINASVTRTLEPSEWLRNPLRVPIPETAAAPRVRLNAGWMWHGANWTYTSSLGSALPASSGAWNGTSFVTRQRHPTITAITGLELALNGAEESPFAAALRSPPVRGNTSDGTWLWPYLTKAPTTYVAAQDEVLAFGAGLSHPQTTGWVDRGELLTTARFLGSLDEERRGEITGADLVLRDEAGNVVRSAKESLPPAAVTPGAYQFEVTKPGVRLVTTLDTRRIDGAPPSLTSLRLLDATGRVTASLRAREAGALLFSAIDRVPAPDGGAKRGSVVVEATRLQWRPHGTTGWHTLPLTIAGHEIANGQEEFDVLGHVPVGTAYRADLTPVTQTATPIDIAIHIEDVSGNAYDYTIESAFVVHGERRRGVRH